MMGSPSRRVVNLPRLVACSVLALALTDSAFLAWRSREMPYLGSLHDDSIYWVTAKSIADGKGYRILSFPGQPFQTKYPPFYPLLLSTVWLLWPTYPQNLFPALVMNFLILVLVVVVLRKLYRSLGLNQTAALLLCAIFLLDPYVNVLATSLMSEHLFLLLFLTAMQFAESASAHPDRNYACGAGMLAGLAYLTRVAALPVIVTTPLIFLLQRRYRSALIFMASMLPWILGWGIWTRAHYEKPGDFVSLYYLDYVGEYRHFFSLKDVPHVALINFERLWNGFAMLLGVAFFPWLAGIVGLIAVAGAVHLVHSSGCWHYAAFSVGYFLEMLLWPYVGVEGRLSFPLFPLLLAGICQAFLVALLYAIKVLNSAAGWRNIPAFGLIFAQLALAFVWAVSTASGLNALRLRAASNNPAASGSKAAYAWIVQNTPRDSIIIAKRDCILYLNTGRAAFFPFESPRVSYWPNEPPLGEYPSVAAIAWRHHAQFTLITGSDSEGGVPPILKPIELADRGVYKKVFTDGAISVYEILHR